MGERNGVRVSIKGVTTQAGLDVCVCLQVQNQWGPDGGLDPGTLAQHCVCDQGHC